LPLYERAVLTSTTIKFRHSEVKIYCNKKRISYTLLRVI
jgi:hypothetical protein